MVIVISQYFLRQKKEKEPGSRFLDAKLAPSNADKGVLDLNLLVSSSVPLHNIPLGSYYSPILKSSVQLSSNFNHCGWRSKVRFVIIPA